MTEDPKSIEGSPERAADRGREEDLGFVVTSKPSLGDPDVVRGLVSEFASGIVSIRCRYNAGKLDGAKAQDQIRDLAREYGGVVMGRDSSYASMPWNDPSRLGRRIGLVVPPIDGVVDPGELLFLTIGGSLIGIALSHEEGRLPDADGERQTQSMLEDMADLILGVR